MSSQLTLAFKGLAKCRECGASFVGEEKFKRRKDGGRNRHVYYHCSRQVEYYCTQPYMREADLVNQVLDIIKGLNYYEIKLGSKLKFKLHEYDLMTREHIGKLRTNEEIFYTYADYLMRLGDNKEKAEFIRALNLPLVVHNRRIHYSPDEYQQQPTIERA